MSGVKTSQSATTELQTANNTALSAAETEVKRLKKELDDARKARPPAPPKASTSAAAESKLDLPVSTDVLAGAFGLLAAGEAIALAQKDDSNSSALSSKLKAANATAMASARELEAVRADLKASEVELMQANANITVARVEAEQAARGGAS